MTPVIIVGCGYTGTRVAMRLLEGGVEVHATTREPFLLKGLADRGARLSRLDVNDIAMTRRWAAEIPPGGSALLSIPTLKRDDGRLLDPTPQIIDALGDRPSRVVYLSTTGVYGHSRDVDENTPAAPETERQRLRVQAEQAITKGPWSSLVLRPAAIYGPWRGVHEAMRKGRYKLVGEGKNYVSRIHVEDLAWHAAEALGSEATGAYPVADEEPCRSREIAAFCANLLDVPMPRSVTPDEADETRRSDRRVDGSFIREELGVDLLYPSYRIGIKAALIAERSFTIGDI